jgi:hypothetical protein
MIHIMRVLQLVQLVTIANAQSDKCGGNGNPSPGLSQPFVDGKYTTYQYACASGTILKQSPHLIPVNTAEVCCDTAKGMCAGNEKTAYGLTEEAGTDTSDDPITYQYSCGNDHILINGAQNVRVSEWQKIQTKPEEEWTFLNDFDTCCRSRIVGMCAGNDMTATDLDMLDTAPTSTNFGTYHYACGPGYVLKNGKLDSDRAQNIQLSGDTPELKRELCCIQIKDMCAGNGATTTGLAEPADDGTFQYNCGTSHTLRPTSKELHIKEPFIKSGGTATADQLRDLCCEPIITCSGNLKEASGRSQKASDGSFQYACPDGLNLKSNGNFLPFPSGAGARAQVCCAAVSGMCAGNKKAAPKLVLHEKASDGTFQYPCGAGYLLTAKARDTVGLSLENTADGVSLTGPARRSVCCDTNQCICESGEAAKGVDCPVAGKVKCATKKGTQSAANAAPSIDVAPGPSTLKSSSTTLSIVTTMSVFIVAVTAFVVL